MQNERFCVFVLSFYLNVRSGVRLSGGVGLKFNSS